MAVKDRQAERQDRTGQDRGVEDRHTQADRQADRLRDRQPYRQIGRQSDRQAERQAGQGREDRHVD